MSIWNILRKFETTLILASGMIVVICSGILYFDLSLVPNMYNSVENYGVKIGHLDSAVNVIKRKRDSVPFWEKVTKESVIYEFDQLFTDTKSSALVKFKDGSELAVGANSLFTISFKTDTNVIEYGAGRININVTKGKSKLILKSGKNRTEVDVAGTELQIKSSGQNNDVSLIVLEGSAKTKVGNKFISIAANEVVKIDSKGEVSAIAKLPIRLLTPTRDATRFGKTLSIQFSWEKLLGSNRITKLQFLLARDSYFDRVIHEAIVSGNEYTVPTLPAGEYHWKIGTSLIDKVTIDSEVRKFTIFESSIPLVIAPEDGQSIQFKERGLDPQRDSDSITVSLSWAYPAGADSFYLQVSDSPSFKVLIFDEAVARNTKALKLAPGPYFWRIRAIDGKIHKNEFSKVARFQINVIKLPRPPRTGSPQSGSSILLSGPDAKVELNWNLAKSPELKTEERGVLTADTFALQISTDQSFNQPLVVSRVKGTSFSWSPKRVGRFFWRVKPLDVYARPTHFSKPFQLSIRETPPILLAPMNGSVIEIPVHKNTVLFNWEKRQYGGYYRFQISRDETFAHLEVNELVEKPSYTWGSPTAEQFYWRVIVPHATDVLDGQSRLKPITEPPPVIFSFEVKTIEAPPPPQLEEEYHFDIDYKNSHYKNLTFPNQNWLLEMFFGPKLWALENEKAKGVTKITWRQIKQARGYRVEISQYDDFKNTMVSQEVKFASFAWEHSSPGHYFFRIAVYDRHGQLSPFSKPAKLSIHFPIPKLLGPETNEGYVIHTKSTSVVLTWDGKSNAYQLMLSTSKDFHQKVFDKVLSAPKEKVKDLLPGEYWWRVRVKGAKRWSVSRSFSIRYKLVAPAQISPLPHEIYNWEEGPAPKILIRWRKVIAANQYEVTVADNLKFENPLVEMKTQLLTTSFVPPKKGTFYLKIRATGPSSTVASEAKPIEFKVHKRLEGKDLKLTTLHEKIFVSNDSDIPVELKWLGNRNIDSYFVEIAESSDFRNGLISRETSLSHQEIMLPGGKQFYWRIFAGRKWSGKNSTISSSKYLTTSRNSDLPLGQTKKSSNAPLNPHDRSEPKNGSTRSPSGGKPRANSLPINIDRAASSRKYGAPSEVRTFTAQAHSLWLANLSLGFLTYLGDQEGSSGVSNIPAGDIKSYTLGSSYGLALSSWLGPTATWGMRAELDSNALRLEFTNSETEEKNKMSFSQIRYGLWLTFWWSWTNSLAAQLMGGVAQQSRYYFAGANSQLDVVTKENWNLSQKGELVWRPNLGLHSVIAGLEIGENISDLSSFTLTADLAYRYHWKNYSIGVKTKAWWQTIQLQLNLSEVDEKRGSTVTNLETANLLTFGVEY